MDQRSAGSLRLPASRRWASVALVCTVFLGSAFVASATTPGAKLWAKRYNGPGNSLDEAYSLDVSPDGTKVFVTGYSYGSSGYADYATLAYDASTGATLWIRRYDGPAKNQDVAYSLAVSLDGTNVFVTGYSVRSTSGHDYATLAYAA